MAIGQALADVSTISILQERSITESAAVNEQLQRALNSRILIEQARGMIAHISDVDTDEAFLRLRAHARSHGTSLSETAEAVLNRKLTVRPAGAVVSTARYARSDGSGRTDESDPLQDPPARCSLAAW